MGGCFHAYLELSVIDRDQRVSAHRFSSILVTLIPYLDGLYPECKPQGNKG